MRSPLQSVSLEHPSSASDANDTTRAHETAIAKARMLYPLGRLKQVLYRNRRLERRARSRIRVAVADIRALQSRACYRQTRRSSTRLAPGGIVPGAAVRTSPRTFTAS